MGRDGVVGVKLIGQRLEIALGRNRSSESEIRTSVNERISKGVKINFSEKSPFHETIVVDELQVPHIIGKQGAFLKTLRQMPGIMHVGLNPNAVGIMELKIGGRSPDCVANAAQRARDRMTPGLE